MLLAVCLWSIGMESLCAQEPHVILISAFSAFAGRDVNGSETVATALDGHVLAGHTVRILVMPVRWGAPAPMLADAVSKEHPALLLGLGEGYPDHIAVEGCGSNHIKQIRDELGHLPNAPLLEATGPAQRLSTLVWNDAWLPASPIPVIASSNAGGYLCDACLYASLALSVPTCGFVHLPPQGAVSKQDYLARVIPVIEAIITHNLAMK
jgi:pyrrolidone-carboxylate peptidase